MFKAKGITAAFLAASLLSVSAVSAEEMASPQQVTAHSFTKENAAAASKAKKQKQNLSFEELDENAKATLKTVSKAMPDIKGYNPLFISKEVENSIRGKIEVYTIILKGESVGDAPNSAYLKIAVGTGELIIAEVANGLVSAPPLKEEAAKSTAMKHLKKLLNKEADHYQYAEQYSYTMGEEGDKAITVVTFTSEKNSVYLALDGQGELKRFLRGIYLPETEE